MNRSVPDVKQINQRLARDAERVARFIDGLPAKVDMLADVTLAKDWKELRRLSDQLSQTGKDFGIEPLAQSATEIRNAIDEQDVAADKEVELRRKVMRLIGECGRTRRPRKDQNSS